MSAGDKTPSGEFCFTLFIYLYLLCIYIIYIYLYYLYLLYIGHGVTELLVQAERMENLY